MDAPENLHPAGEPEPDSAMPRVLLHDYCGHPFQLQLAEELATRGYRVNHVYCGSIPGTPHALAGHQIPGTCDLRKTCIELSRKIEKGAFVQRYRLEREYGRNLAQLIAKEKPEVVVFSNTPVDSLELALRAARDVDARVVIWVQDLLGEAALRILPQKIGIAGKLIGTFYRRREAKLLAQADQLVAITGDFAPFFDYAGVPRDKWTTIPNWAPLDKVEPRQKINPWSIAQGLQDKTVFLYSGTLGFKHNPRLLVDLAEALRDRDDAIVVVNSEGDAANWLKQEAYSRGLSSHLKINGYQPFDQISDVLGSADVLLALLEPDAGAFSVPSKVLSNLCSARPQLLAVPSENLAAKIVADNRAGIVCNPEDSAAFVEAASRLLDDAETRSAMGARARQYALENFEIDRIAEQFEQAFGLNSDHCTKLERNLA